MKRMIVLLAAVMLALSLTACFGTANTSSTADEAKAADIASYDKDFEGIQKYISDRNSGASKQELYYDLLGADDGVRYVLNNNAYVEIYDFGSVTENSATADYADPEKAKSILDDIKDDGKFKPIDDGIEMTAVVTDSGRYVLAWDESRSYDYSGKVATDELKENW